MSCRKEWQKDREKRNLKWKWRHFGRHGIGITNNKKQSEWQHVAAAVNSVSSTERTVPELKKKWSDIELHIFM